MIDGVRSPPEIADFDSQRAVGSDQYIFRLNVSMNYMSSVQILSGITELMNYGGGLGLREALSHAELFE